jgi:hypothetical protein
MKMDSVFLYGVYRICSFESNIKSSFGSHNLKLITIVEFCNSFLLLDDFDID